MGDGVLQRQLLQPALIAAVVVPDLIHDAHGVPAVGVHRLIQRHRGRHGVHGEHHLLTGQLQLLGDLLHRRLPLLLAQEPLTGLQDLIGSVPHTPADPQGAVVPEIAADLPHDHGNAIGGEPHRLTDVKVVDGLDKTDAPHLKQIVGVLAPAAEPLDHRQHQPEIAPDQPLTGRHIPLLGAPEKLHHLVVFQDLQPGCIDPADFHLPLHTPPPPLG